MSSFIQLLRKGGEGSTSANPSSLPVTGVPGVGPARAERLQRLGVETVAQLLRRPPKDYIDARGNDLVADAAPGRLLSVRGVVVHSGWRPTRKDRTLWIGTVVLEDSKGDELQLHWFARRSRGGRLRPLPPPGPERKYIATGVVQPAPGGGWAMASPSLEPAESDGLHAGRIIPVYSLTEGLTQKVMRRIVAAALHAFARAMEDVLPEDVLGETGLLPLADALQQLHFPDDEDALHRARQRFAFEELLLLRLAAAAGRRGGGPKARPLQGREPVFLSRLPFRLTGGQRRVLAEVARDLSRTEPMQRLLQGDVGSGKTVVAAYAAAKAALSGGQAAVVAPSEVLARQHEAVLSEWLAEDDISVLLLTGGTGSGERRRILDKLPSGEPVVVVGTHALFEPSVRFGRLDVVVVDEQHRFGVRQRRALLQAPTPPHVLVVSATPIPRTLAHCVYGDLDVSILDDMPPGRQPVDTRWVRPRRREEVYRFVRRQTEAGGQAFVIFPAIGGDEEAGLYADPGEQLLFAAEALAEGPLKGVPTAVVHGRQSVREQTEAMERFRRGEVKVLLATTVVEVGVDVPRASVIVIEGADKFGLAQLHQLRGRVGRGGGDAWCFLVAEPRTLPARRRLQALRRHGDGFAVAEHDLALRGPGELFGLRQSGLPDVSAVAQRVDRTTANMVDVWARRLLQRRRAGETGDDVKLWRAVRRRVGGQRFGTSGV